MKGRGGKRAGEQTRGEKRRGHEGGEMMRGEMSEEGWGEGRENKGK